MIQLYYSQIHTQKILYSTTEILTNNSAFNAALLKIARKWQQFLSINRQMDE